MTLVDCTLTRPSDAGPVPVTGVLEWRPSRRGTAAGDVPAPFSVRTGVTIPVTPTGADWCWIVTEQVPGGNADRGLLIPDTTATLTYPALTEVDPTSFEPTASPDPAWVGQLARLSAEVAALGDIPTAVAAYLAAHPVTSGMQWTQTVASAQWSITHNLGRLPVVATWIGGARVYADETSTTTQTTITFPTPQTGIAVLT